MKKDFHFSLIHLLIGVTFIGIAAILLIILYRPSESKTGTTVPPAQPTIIYQQIRINSQ